MAHQVTLQPPQHVVATPFRQRLLQLRAIEVDEHDAHLVAAHRTQHVVDVQVRVAQPGPEGEPDHGAERRRRLPPPRRVIPQELHQRHGIGFAFGAQPQPPEGAAAAGHGRDRHHHGHPFLAQRLQQLELTTGAARPRIAVLQQARERTAAAERPHHELAAAEFEATDAPAPLGARQRVQLGPERLEPERGQVRVHPADGAALPQLDEGGRGAHGTMIDSARAGPTIVGLEVGAGTAMLRAPMTTAASPTTLPGEPHLPRGGRVLVVRLSALGDVLFALETVAALHHERPDVQIDFLVEDRFQSLLVDHPQLDQVLVYPRRRRLAIPASIWRLRRRRYDVVLDVHGIQKSAMHVLAARARLKVGPAGAAAREGAPLAYHRKVVMDPAPHRAEVGHRLLRAIGLSGEPAPPQLGLAPIPADLLRDLPRPRVFLHPGTSAFAAFKRWPSSRFAQLAEALATDGISVLVGFGPGEAELAAPVLAAAPHARAIDGKQLGLLGMATVMQQCDVVVAADTGPLHLGAAVGARCVALFGPKDERRYGPRAHGPIAHEILHHDVPCRPCRRRDCVTPLCVLGIEVAAVHAAVRRQLAAGAAP